jgi:hypothetical protein
MSAKISLLLGIFLVLATVAVAAESAAPPPTDSSGVLLLRNGQVIEGHIEREGNYYHVTMPDQEIREPVADVEFACHDLREGYRQKKAMLPVRDIEQHIQLCLWCERHGLLDCAGDELNAAESLDREHPMISVLRRRLKVEMQQRSAPCRVADSVPLPPSDEQLDRMTRGMPPGTVEAFVLIVQPILLNHCPGAVGFALPGQKRLQLMRPPLGESPSRRITQRNLYAVLECVDWDNPGESPLLKASVGSSATPTVGSFPNKNSQQYEKLRLWVYQVAQKPLPVEEAVYVAGENASFADLAAGTVAPTGLTTISQAGPRMPYVPSPTSDKDKSAAKTAGKAATEGNASSKSPATGHLPLNGAKPRKTTAEIIAPVIDAIDPYDPAAFNNQANAPTTLPTPASRVLRGNEPVPSKQP